MCELPANVVFADEFLRVFDGYSIGSNDLTQLALGLDRDSEMVAHLFDERNGAVERMIEQAIEAAQRAGKKIGICGQAPSDYPEFARFLVERGISSISLNPDTVIETTQTILDAESQMRLPRVVANNGDGHASAQPADLAVAVEALPPGAADS
jgi:pyruvate,water dikinase